MATTAQVALTTAGTGSLAAAGAYGITQAVKGNEESLELPSELAEKVLEPESKKLTETTSQTYPDKTLGYKQVNKSLLVDFKDVSNEQWWKWAYENIFKIAKEKSESKINPLFKVVNKPYDAYVQEQSETDKTSLNYACHKAYGLKWYDFTSENRLLENVKLFCSPLLATTNLQEPEEQEPSSVKLIKDIVSTNCTSDATYKDKLGCKENNKDYLVAPIGKEGVTNEDWWKWVYKKHFLAEKSKNTPVHADFGSVVSAYAASAKTDPTNSPQVALNQACDVTYKRNFPESDEKLPGNIKLFCSKGVTGSISLKINN